MASPRPSRVVAVRTLLAAVVDVRARFFQVITHYLHRKALLRLAFFLSLASFALLSASGCTNLWQAGWDSVSAVKPRTIDLQKETLDPNAQYLKLSINRQESVLVLAYEDANEQVWVSSNRAVLRTQAGYLQSMDGFAINWSGVPLPDLERALRLRKPMTYHRTRHEQPGYRYAIRETVELKPLPGAPAGIPADLDVQNLRWFSETVLAQFGEPMVRDTPNAIFAIEQSSGKPRIRYMKQCLQSDYCLAWHAVNAKPNALTQSSKNAVTPSSLTPANSK